MWLPFSFLISPASLHMNEISCDMCMDLMPLVHDGVASADSAAAVQHHIQNCPDCRALFEGTIPAPDNGREIMEKILRKSQLFSAMVLMFGIFFGLSLTASSELFYNTLIMPILGAIGYFLFRWKALYTVPCLLLVTHLITNTFGLIRGAEHLDIASLFLWTGLYCIFALIGTSIAGLLHFALRKEK